MGIRWLARFSSVLGLVAGLAAWPAAAQDDDPAAQAALRTPEQLARALECRSRDGYFAIGMALIGKDRPSWLSETPDNGHPGMLGLESFQLAAPITVFGERIDRVSFLNQWVVAELPRATALKVIAQQTMDRAPIRATEQYYHFIDDGAGPMLGAFEPTDDALEVAFGGAPKARGPSPTLFVGCNYAPMSKAAFLDAARQADAFLGKANHDIRKMVEDAPAPKR